MQTTAQSPQKPLGFAPQIDTHQRTGLAGAAETAVHNAPATRRRQYKARARRCIVCQKLFTPARNKSAKTCSIACRCKLYRQRTARRTPTLPRQPELVAVVCPYCGRGALRQAGKGAKWCSDTCRTLASRARRSAAVRCLIDLRMDAQVADEIVEAAGMKTITARLEALGWHYSDAARAFVEDGAR